MQPPEETIRLLTEENQRLRAELAAVDDRWSKAWSYECSRIAAIHDKAIDRLEREKNELLRLSVAHSAEVLTDSIMLRIPTWPHHW